MSEATAQVPPIAVAPPRRRRWWLRGVLLLLGLAILGPTLTIGYRIHSAQIEWDRAVAEATELDPRWKLEEIEADRPQVPDAENAALFIIALRKKGGGVVVAAAPRYEQLFDKLPPTAQLNDQQMQLLRGQLAKIAGPLAEARKLKDMPRGRFPVTYSDIFFATLIPNHHDARDIADWLKHDAYDLAQQGRVDEAVESCQAVLTAGRVFKDETFVISVLIRTALQGMAVDALERVLAQGEPSEEALAATQAMLQREANASGWLQAVRGDRAGIHFYMENIRSGKIKDGRLTRSVITGKGPTNLSEWFADQFPTSLLQSYPEHLRHLTRCVEVAKLPIHERGVKVKELDGAADKSADPLVQLFTPLLAKAHQAECRSQAWLRTAQVAIACERYGRKHDQWPERLDDLVTAKLLDALPTDPIDGQPLRYRVTKAGIVVYSIGIDETDNQGTIDHAQANQPGFDIGFRLWHPTLRRQPALPPQEQQP